MASSWATMPPKDTPISGRVPPDRIEQAGGIVAVVGHGVRPVGDFGLAEAPLVVRGHLEGFGEGAVAESGLLAQVSTGPGNEQKPLPCPGQLVIQGNAVDRSEGHACIVAVRNLDMTTHAVQSCRPCPTLPALSHR